MTHCSLSGVYTSFSGNYPSFPNPQFAFYVLPSLWQKAGSKVKWSFVWKTWVITVFEPIIKNPGAVNITCVARVVARMGCSFHGIAWSEQIKRCQSAEISYWVESLYDQSLLNLNVLKYVKPLSIDSKTCCLIHNTPTILTSKHNKKKCSYLNWHIKVKVVVYGLISSLNALYFVIWQYYLNYVFAKKLWLIYYTINWNRLSAVICFIVFKWYKLQSIVKKS